jgi:hypothetical protein
LDSDKESESSHDIEHDLGDHTLTNIKHDLEDFLNVLTQSTSKTYFIKNYLGFLR